MTKTKTSTKKETKKPTKVVDMPKQYTLGLGFKDPNLVNELKTVLGEQQYSVLMEIFTSINKFTQTTIMSVLPDLLKQVHSVVYNERLRLIQESVAHEEGREVEKPMAVDKQEVKINSEEPNK